MNNEININSIGTAGQVIKSNGTEAIWDNLISSEIKINPNTNRTVKDMLYNLTWHNTVICVGDSYGEGWYDDRPIGGTSGNIKSWCKHFCENYGKTLNSSYFLAVEGGSGFNANYGVTHKTFQQLLSSLANSSNFDTAYKKEMVGLIVVCGGYNEPASTEAQRQSLQQKVSQFCEYAHNQFPYAQIIIANIGNTINRSGIDYKKRINIETAYYMGSAGYGYVSCFKNAYKCFDGLHKKDYFSGDGIHPNAQGQLLISKALLNYINGCGVQDCSNLQFKDYTDFNTSSDLYKKRLSVWYYKDYYEIRPSDNGSNVIAQSNNLVDSLSSGLSANAVMNSNTSAPRVKIDMRDAFVLNCENNAYRQEVDLMIGFNGTFSLVKGIAKADSEGRIEIILYGLNSQGTNYLTTSTTIGQVYLLSNLYIPIVFCN